MEYGGCETGDFATSELSIDVKIEEEIIKTERPHEPSSNSVSNSEEQLKSTTTESQRLARNSPQQANLMFNDHRRFNNHSLWQKHCKIFHCRNRYITVFLLAWLIMNTDPAYSQRARNSLRSVKLLRRSFLTPFGFPGPTTDRNTGLNAVEAIALIHAMNNNRQQDPLGDLGSLANNVKGPTSRQNQLIRQITQPISSSTSTTQRQQTALDRQIPVPVPIPAPLAAVVAAVAAFAAAVLAGFTPIAAVVAALAAAAAAFLAALLAAILAIIAVLPAKRAPIVKKLVIKKTVLPFVIPIPFKKKEKEVIYKYIPKPVHVHSHEEKKEKGKHHDHHDLSDSDEAYAETGRLDKIQSLLSEQDNLQMLVDGIVKKDKSQQADSAAQPLNEFDVVKK